MAQNQSLERPTICLISAHPITIAEFQGLLYLGNYSLRTKRADALSTASPDEMPSADIYAIELLPSAEATQEAVARLLAREPEAKILLIGEEFTETNAFPLLSMGVKGLLHRSELHGSLTRALDALHQNGFWVPRTLLSKFVSNVLNSTRRMLFALGTADLTETQTNLLNAMMETDSDEELATRLQLTPEQLKIQISDLMHKFNVRRRWDLVLLAHQASGRALRHGAG